MNDAFIAAAAAAAMLLEVGRLPDFATKPARSTTMTITKRIAALLATALVAAAAAPALAVSDRNGTEQELARARAALEAKGYRDVHDLEVDDGRFEVDAVNAQGERVDLELDLETFEVLYEDRD
jgi:hypothetical protein